MISLVCKNGAKFKLKWLYWLVKKGRQIQIEVMLLDGKNGAKFKLTNNLPFPPKKHKNGAA